MGYRGIVLAKGRSANWTDRYFTVNSGDTSSWLRQRFLQLGCLPALLLRVGASLWVTATWAAICSPIVVVIGICLLAPIERMAVGLGLSRGGVLPRFRPTVVFWIISGIGLPWIAAWLAADLMGDSFDVWWQAKGAGGVDFYL